MRKRFVILAAAALIAACTAKYPVVGSFDDFNEVFLGDVNANLMSGTSTISVKAKNTGVQCRGGSKVTYVPASNYIAGAFLVPYCNGQRGTASLRCDDGRRIDADWTADSCTSGYGEGSDQHGARFQFAFGMSQSEAQARFKKEGLVAESKPDLPVYRPKETRKKIGFSTGTGFLVTDDGHMVTNFHVIEDAKSVFIRHDGKEIPAEVVSVDKKNDVALLKTPINGPAIRLSKTSASVAEDVMTMGYPLISIQGQALKASFGRVNALSGIQDDPNFVQIDVPIQPGNSGGPLMNRSGELVGVVTATLNQFNALREAGTLPQNVNYAVKAHHVRTLLKDVAAKDGPGKPSSFQALAERYKNSVYLVVAK